MLKRTEAIIKALHVLPPCTTSPWASATGPSEIVTETTSSRALTLPLLNVEPLGDMAGDMVRQWLLSSSESTEPVLLEPGVRWRVECTRGHVQPRDSRQFSEECSSSGFTSATTPLAKRLLRKSRMLSVPR